MGDVSGQHPKKPLESPPAPLLPAEQAWLRALPAPPASDGAMDAVRVYIPLREGGLLALTRETGEDVWVTPVETSWPLLVAGTQVLAVTTDAVAAIDGESGSMLWQVSLPARAIAPAVVGGDLLVIPLESGSLMAVRTADGQFAWSRAIDGLVTPVALSAGGSAVYATMDKNVVAAVRLASGELIWRGRLDGVLSPPAIGKDRVFVGSTSNTLYGLNAETGRVEFRWPPGMIGGDVIGAAVDGDITYFTGLDNLLHAINRSNGNQRWKQATPTRPIAPPVAFGGIVAVFGVSPAIATFNAKTGAPIATYVIPTAPGATTAPVPKGPPLIDPDLRPFRVAFVVVTADGRAIGLRPTGMMFRDPPLAPLTELPGRALQRERLPNVSGR